MRRFALLLVVAIAGSTLVAPRAHAQVKYLGSIMITSFGFAPKGFAQCNGQLLPISQDTALFALLGTFYGGDGRTTFALPDLRGRVIVGMGQGPGLSNYDQGEIGGQENVTITLSQMPPHSHTPMGVSSADNVSSPTGNNWGAARALLYSTATPNTPMSSMALGSVGGGQPFPNMKPYLVVNYVIALQGIFPSRN